MGVPGFGGGPLLPPPPPPPHPNRIKTSTIPAVSETGRKRHSIPRGLDRREMPHAIAAIAVTNTNRLDGLLRGSAGGGSGLARGATSDGAVVVMVTVTLAAELPGVSGLGEIVQPALEGTPVQLNVTGWLMPASPCKL